MRAYVNVNNGRFPNVNFFLAWEGFNRMGYSVTLFEEKDIPTLDITLDTPVFAGVTIFRKIIDKLGINYPPFDCYPDVLTPYYRRSFRKSTMGVEKEKFYKDGVRVFVKPVLPKQFVGRVWNSIADLILTTNVPDTAEVWVCEPVEILSEFRVYVYDGDILGVKHYCGDWNLTPPKEFIERVVKTYKSSPIAYGVDIGINKQHGFVIEVNDGCNLGNYGLDSINYGRMIVSRWFEIMADSSVNKKIDADIKESERYDKEYGVGNRFSDARKKMYFEPFMIGSRNHKDILVKNASDMLKLQAMKTFVKESKENYDTGN